VGTTGREAQHADMYMEFIMSVCQFLVSLTRSQPVITFTAKMTEFVLVCCQLAENFIGRLPELKIVI
jgi:hypothetical protein